jgi:rubrerythrin
MFTAEEILDMAIRLEQNAETVYRQAMDKVSDPEFIEMLEWIRREEIKHAAWFEGLKANLGKRPENPISEEMHKEMFEEMIGEESFSLREVNFEEITSLDELIGVFIEFEKDTILFYEMLQPFIQEEEALNQLKKIIAEENRHIDCLREFLARKTPETAAEGW